MVPDSGIGLPGAGPPTAVSVPLMVPLGMAVEEGAFLGSVDLLAVHDDRATRAKWATRVPE